MNDEPKNRINADPEAAERSLVSLVLTVVELLRQLMERQALRPFTAGTWATRRSRRSGRR